MNKRRLKMFLTGACCFVLCGTIIGLCIWGFLKEKPIQLSDSQKVERVLSKTGKIIEKNNRTFVNSFNQNVEANKDHSSSGTGVDAYSIDHSGYYEYSVEELIADAVENVNIYEQYYVYFEYFREFLNDSFLDNTIFVKQNIISDDIWATFKLNSDNMELKIKVRDDKGGEDDVDYMLATLYFDSETYEPIKLDYFDEFRNYAYSTPYKYCRQISFDFKKSTFNFIEISMGISENSANFTKKSDEYILNNSRAFDFYKVDFNSFANCDGAYFYTNTFNSPNFSSAGLTNAHKDIILNNIKAASFKDFDNFESNFDFDKQITYENGNECLIYAQNKYIIEKREVGEDLYLVARQANGIDDKVLDLLLDFKDIYTGNFNLGYENQFNFVKDDVNYKKTLNSGMFIPENDFSLLLNWFENNYDENKYYFKEENVNGFSLIISNSGIEIRKKTADKLIYMEFYVYSNNRSVNIYEVTDGKIKYYKLNNYFYSNSQQTYSYNDWNVSYGETAINTNDLSANDSSIVPDEYNYVQYSKNLSNGTEESVYYIYEKFESEDYFRFYANKDNNSVSTGSGIRTIWIDFSKLASI